MLETQSKIEYKMLAGPALKPLLLKLVEQGEPLPNIALAIAFVAVDEEGKIKAHCVIQSLPVLEPTHAEPEHGEHLRPLVEMSRAWVLESGVPRVIVRTSDNCQLISMVEEEKIPALPGKCFDWRREP